MKMTTEFWALSPHASKQCLLPYQSRFGTHRSMGNILGGETDQ